MKKQLFPVEIIENSTEQLIKKHSVKSYIIYNIVIFTVVIAFILSFFISIDINVASAGMIKTPGERIIVNSPYSAFVADIYARENLVVEKGDTLVILNSERYDNDLLKLRHRQVEVNDYLRDLRKLLKVKKGDFVSSIKLSTPLYTKSYNYYVSQCVDFNNKAETARSNYNRNKKLLEYGDISAAEFEPIEAEYRNLGFAIDLFYDRQINEWQSALDGHFAEVRDLRAQIEAINIQKNESVITSPVSGFIQRIEGISRDSYIQQGQRLFEISIDSVLYVECMIEPKNVGFVQVGQDVRMQVDAFNYNEWGFAEGKVIEVFNDVIITEVASGSAPFFRVICSIDTPSLQLKNGYVGELKRGMTVNTRFKIARRTLFQLLYDKVDDWMNPNVQGT